MKRPKIVCGWGSAPDPAEVTHVAPTAPLVGWRVGHASPFLSLDAIDRCSWMFVGQQGKMDIPQFLKRGCALVVEL